MICDFFRSTFSLTQFWFADQNRNIYIITYKHTQGAFGEWRWRWRWGRAKRNQNERNVLVLVKCMPGAWECTPIYKIGRARKNGNNSVESPQRENEQQKNRNCERLKVKQHLSARTDRNYVYCMPWQQTRTNFTHALPHWHRTPSLPLRPFVEYRGKNDMNVVGTHTHNQCQHTIYVCARRLLGWCVIFPWGILFNANFAIFVHRIESVLVENYRSPCNSRVYRPKTEAFVLKIFFWLKNRSVSIERLDAK